MKGEDSFLCFVRVKVRMMETNPSFGMMIGGDSVRNILFLSLPKCSISLLFRDFDLFLQIVGLSFL